MKSKVMLVLLLVVLFIIIIPTVALADNYDGAGTVTIDTPWAPGTLQNAVNAVAGPFPVNNLYITAADTITSVDETYIVGLSLQLIDISGSTTYNTVRDNMFNSHLNIQSITLPCTSTGFNFARKCPSLTSVSLPNATSLGDYSIEYNENLTSVNLPNLTSIGIRNLAYNGNLTSLSLPNVTSLGDYSIGYNINLIDLSLPKATTFGEATITYNDSLTTISLPKATTFGNHALVGNVSMTTLSLPEATTFGSYALATNNSLTTISLPKATTFGQYAFSYNNLLTSVSTPSATTFGSFIFENNPLQITWELGSTIPNVASFASYNVAGFSPILNVPDTAFKTYDLDDGVDDNLWYGWTLNANIVQVENPQTGDEVNYGLIFVLSVVVLVILIGFVVLKVNKVQA